MNEWYVEYRRTVQRAGPPQFVAIEDLDGLQGFRGVYAVQEETARALADLGSTKPLSSTPVWSDTLFVDFDDTEGSLELADYLRVHGIGFEVWATGRRGCHFHIPTEPTFGRDVPARHLQWVEQHVRGAWDRTLYRHTAIIRLPGTFHEKEPGMRKALADWNEGERLVVPPLYPGTLSTISISGEEPSGGSETKARFYSALVRPASQRNAHIYHMGRLSIECDLAYHEALDAVKWWARSVARPALDVSDQEIERQFNNGRHA